MDSILEAIVAGPLLAATYHVACAQWLTAWCDMLLEGWDL
jgi:hypothetical protein